MKRREYNDKVIESGFSKASEINRNDLLEYKEKEINKQVPLVLTYHPSLENISGIVRHHWKENQRQKKESFWICELQTLHPEGINKKA